MEVKKFPELKPLFLLEEVKNVLGIPKTAPLDEQLKSLVEESKKEAVEIIEPKGLFADVGIFVNEDSVLIDTGGKREKIESKRLAKRLSGCSEAFIFIVTIGNGLEKRVNDYIKQGEYTKALVLDAVGSAFAEGLAEAAQKYLEEIVPQEVSLTPRFSPGYGDLKLEVQKFIFDILKPETINVELTSSFMMKPRKSITAITGKLLTDEA